MSKFFYHGVDDLLTMLKIIDCGYIKSKRQLGFSKENDFNGLDYISLCNKESNDMYIGSTLNSFDNYIKNNFCFIISNDINATKCEYIDISKCTEEQVKLLSNSDVRYSDMFDEWQVKDSISLNDVVGIGLPLNYLNKIRSGYYNSEYQIERVFLIANMLNLDIINTDEEDFIEKYENSKEVNNGVGISDTINSSNNRKNKTKTIKK